MLSRVRYPTLAALLMLSSLTWVVALPAASEARPTSFGPASRPGWFDTIVRKPPTPDPNPPKSVKIVIKNGTGVTNGYFSSLTHKTANGNGTGVSVDGSKGGERKISVEDSERARGTCFALTADAMCFIDDNDTMANAGLLTGSLARAIAVTLVTELRLPTPTPRFGPDPDNNEWKMLAVGFPVWLWTDGPTSVSTSASASGFTFRMSARLRSTTFHMGDGSSITCTSMSTYSSAVKPGAPSPDCGHVYTQPSLPKGKYTVRAVADWDVSWSVAGFSGVIPAYNDATATIPIGELVALNR